MTHEDFAPYLHKSFRFDGWGGTLRLVRIDVRRERAGARTPFVLVFEGPRGDGPEQGLYRAVVEDGPEFQLHIMPIHTVPPDRREYQAVFN